MNNVFVAAAAFAALAVAPIAFAQSTTAPAAIKSRCGDAPAKPSVPAEVPSRQKDADQVLEKVNGYTAQLNDHLACRSAEIKEKDAELTALVAEAKAVRADGEGFNKEWQAKFELRNAEIEAKNLKKKR